MGTDSLAFEFYRIFQNALSNIFILSWLGILSCFAIYYAARILHITTWVQKENKARELLEQHIATKGQAEKLALFAGLAVTDPAPTNKKDEQDEASGGEEEDNFEQVSSALADNESEQYEGSENEETYLEQTESTLSDKEAEESEAPGLKQEIADLKAKLENTQLGIGLKLLVKNRDRANFDLQAILKTTYDIGLARVTKWRNSPNIMLLLGLLGTLLGLILVFQNLGASAAQAMDLHAQGAYFRNLKLALEKMSWAFLSSLAGLVFSLTLSGVLNHVASKQIECTKRIHNFLLTEASSVLLPISESSLGERFLEQINEGEQFFERLKTSIEEASNSFSSTLYQVGSTLKDLLENLGNTSQTIDKGIESLSDSLAGATEATHLAASELAKAANNFEEKFEKAKVETIQQIEASQEVLAQSQGMAEQLTNQFQQLVSDVGAQTNEATNKISETATALSLTNENLRKIADSVAELEEKLQANLSSGFHNIQSEIEEIVGITQTNIADVTTSVSTAFEDIQSDIEELIGITQDNVASVSTTFEKMQQDLLTNWEKILTDRKITTEHLHEPIEALVLATSELSTQVEQSNKVTPLLEASLNELRKSKDLMEKLVASLKNLEYLYKSLPQASLGHTVPKDSDDEQQKSSSDTETCKGSSWSGRSPFSPFSSNRKPPATQNPETIVDNSFDATTSTDPSSDLSEDSNNEGGQAFDQDDDSKKWEL